MNKKILNLVLVPLLAGSVLLTGTSAHAMGSQAGGTTVSGPTAVTQSSDASALASRIRQLGVGESISIDNVNIKRSVTGVEVSVPNEGICASTITTILFGMGGIAIAALAFATAGAGGAVVGGFWLTTGQLYGAASIAGSFSALYAFIDSKVCD